MTRPGSSRRPSPAVAAAMSGAVDLSGLKERAQAATTAQQPAPQTGDDGSGAVTSIAVTEANFEADVLQRSAAVPVVVALISSSRSPDSVQLADTLARLAAADGGTWVLARVDIDNDMRIAQAFGVQAIPTVVAVAAGQPLADFQGPQPEAQLRNWIDAILDAVEGKLSGPPPGTAPQEVPADPRFVAAESALDSGDLAGAEAAYQTILDAEPANADAQAALRQVRFLARAQDTAPDAVTQADANPADIDLALAAADAELFAQDPDAAFGRLIALIKRTSGDDRTRVRTRLVELFELFDTAEPSVVAARRKLAAALY